MTLYFILIKRKISCWWCELFTELAQNFVPLRTGSGDIHRARPFRTSAQNSIHGNSIHGKFFWTWSQSTPLRGNKRRQMLRICFHLPTAEVKPIIVRNAKKYT